MVCRVRFRVIGLFRPPGVAEGGFGVVSGFPPACDVAAIPGWPGRIVRVGPRAPLAGQPLPPAPWAYARLPLPIAQVALARAPLRSGAFSAKIFLFATMIHTPKALGVERWPAFRTKRATGRLYRVPV